MNYNYEDDYNFVNIVYIIKCISFKLEFCMALQLVSHGGRHYYDIADNEQNSIFRGI